MATQNTEATSKKSEWKELEENEVKLREHKVVVDAKVPKPVYCPILEFDEDGYMKRVEVSAVQLLTLMDCVNTECNRKMTLRQLATTGEERVEGKEIPYHMGSWQYDYVTKAPHFGPFYYLCDECTSIFPFVRKKEQLASYLRSVDIFIQALNSRRRMELCDAHSLAKARKLKEICENVK